jgi:hypothetical protein
MGREKEEGHQQRVDYQGLTSTLMRCHLIQQNPLSSSWWSRHQGVNCRRSRSSRGKEVGSGRGRSDLYLDAVLSELREVSALRFLLSWDEATPSFSWSMAALSLHAEWTCQFSFGKEIVGAGVEGAATGCHWELDEAAAEEATMELAAQRGWGLFLSLRTTPSGSAGVS